MEFDPNQSIVERHIRAIFGLEEAQARLLIKEYKAALSSLKAQLLSTADNSFTEGRLETTIAQIEEMIKAMEAAGKKNAYKGFQYAFDNGIDDAVSEINRFEKEFEGGARIIPIDAILESTDSRNILLNRYDSSLLSYTEGLRAGVQRTLTQALIQGKTYSQVVNDVDIAIGGTMWQAHRITRTEMHNIYNISKMDGMVTIKDKYIPDLKKMLVHPMDVRTAADSKTLASINPVVEIDKPFEFAWRGEKRVFMNPPDRPNDRSILIPVRDAYLK